MAIHPDGVYKLKERIDNPKPSGGYKLWTACSQIPPGENESEWPYRDLDDFLIVIQDVDIAGRTYKEAVLANAAWTSGFYIGEVPSPEHFPGISEEDLEEEMMDAFYSHSDEPAPQGFLDALVPAKGQTLEEILLMYSQYEGVDPANRLDKHRWPETVYLAMVHECRNDPQMLEKAHTAIRRLLIRDSKRRRDTFNTYDDAGNVDHEAKKKREKEETRRLLEVRTQQHKAFMAFDHAQRLRNETKQG